MSRMAVRVTAAPVASPADKWVSRAAGGTVAALAGLAGAISYSHMRQLAAEHGQAGWHAHAFPLSVDGLELVASLVILADRRRGRRSGWLPWAALVVGTAGSLAANIATAHPDAISRTIAGWPALALLIAVKLLSGLLARHDSPANAAPVPGPALASTGSEHAGGNPSRVSNLQSPDPVDLASHRSANSRSRPRSPTGTSARRPGAAPSPVASDVDLATAALLPAARLIGQELTSEGQAITRDALAARLRQRGYQIRNSRLTPLLRALREAPANSSAPHVRQSSAA